MNNSKLLFALLILSASLQACASGPYTVAPTDAWVVDAQTGDPVEGAVIVAYWETKYGFFMEDYKLDAHHIMETTTDKEGHFALPGWGPELLTGGSLDENAPRLLIFKPLYRGRVKSGLDSVWNHKKIPLERYSGNMDGPAWKAYADDFAGFAGEFNFILYNHSRCDWKKIPLMLSAQIKQKKIINEHGYPWVDTIASNLVSNSEELSENCGSTVEFVQGLGN